MRLLSIALLAGCTVGEGQGVVVGSLWVPGCDGDEDFDKSDLDAFDLDADFFAGQPVLDPDEDEDAARDSLLIRLQHGGANTEIADALAIQVIDIAKVRPGEVEDVIPAGCRRDGAPGGDGEDGHGDPRGCVRADLSLALTCPDALEDLRAEAADPAVPCPYDVSLEGLFSGDFNDPDAFEDPFWDSGPHPSCILFDRIGTDFGDEIAAVFHFGIRDGRTLDGTEGVGGYLRGRFRFKLERGPGAQAFP